MPPHSLPAEELPAPLGPLIDAYRRAVYRQATTILAMAGQPYDPGRRLALEHVIRALQLVAADLKASELDKRTGQSFEGRPSSRG